MKTCLTLFSSLVIFSASIFPDFLTVGAVNTTCPVNALSCSNHAGDSCCSPTHGLLFLVQSWYEGLGPEDYFTMAGLRYNSCSGSFTPGEGCDVSRSYPNLDAILQKNQTLYNDMKTYWPSIRGPLEGIKFWTHVWNKQGTCVSTLDPKCFSNFKDYQDVYGYFGTALQLFHEYDLYAMLNTSSITPGATYRVDQLESAIASVVGVKPKISCSGSNTLTEISLAFHVVNGTQYVPTNHTQRSICRGGNVYYPRK